MNIYIYTPFYIPFGATSGEAPDSISPLLQAVAVFRQQDLEQHLCSSRRCVYHEGCSRISAKPKLS